MREREDDRPVAVVGGGTMGCGIALCLAGAGHRVVVAEPVAAARRTGRARLRDGVRLVRLLGQGRTSSLEAADSVRWTEHVTDLDTARFVIECAPERIPLKEKLFRDLEATCPPDTVFASCTSAIPISLLASHTRRPDRVLGTHFMNPAPLKDSVEVVRTELTSEETLDRTAALLASMGKTGIVVSDAPGFVSNRVLMSTVNDAATVVQEGTADAATVDRIFQDCLGHRMGPLRTADLIGLDTVVDTLLVLLECTGDSRFQPCDLLLELVENGCLGRKSGQGFHRCQTR